MKESHLQDVIRAIEGNHRNYKIYKHQPATLSSKSRQWDYVIRVCTGCRDQLTGYDDQKGHAFCLSCRQALFPEARQKEKSSAHQKVYHLRLKDTADKNYLLGPSTKTYNFYSPKRNSSRLFY